MLGLWRHVRRHWPFTYEPTSWSVVFPLGMYSVATLSFGKVAHLGFMEPISRFMLWVAVAAWMAVAVAFVVRLVRRPSEPWPEPLRVQTGRADRHGTSPSSVERPASAPGADGWSSEAAW